MTGVYSGVKVQHRVNKFSDYALSTSVKRGVSFLNCDDLGASLFAKRSIFIILKDQVVNIFTGIV